VKRRLLIIDDEEIIRNSLKAYLNSSGYEVAAAADSANAFKLIADFDPEILLLDLYFEEGLNGIEMLKIVKSMKPDLKVVMVTGFGEKKEIEEECFRLGAVRFLYKPLGGIDTKKQLDAV